MQRQSVVRSLVIRFKLRVRMGWAVMVAAGCLDGAIAGAQRIDVNGAPVRVTKLGDRVLGPITYVGGGSRADVILLGGPSHQQIAVVDTAGRGTSTALSDIGAALGSPIAAAFISPNEIMVLDGQSPRLARIRIAASGLKFETVAETELSRISGACSLGGKQFVMAKRGMLEDGGIVHEVTGRGAVAKSFGRRFSEIINPAVGYGHVLCAQAAGLVLAVSRLLPEVRAYSGNGDMRWTLSMPAFRSMGFETRGRAILFAVPPDSLWDEVVSVFQAATNVVAVQIARRHGGPGARSYQQLRTVFVSPRGALLGEQERLPLVKAVAANKLFVVDDRSPDELQIYSYTYRP